MIGFIFRVLRRLVATAAFAALIAKLVLRSNAEEHTQEIDLVAIFGGQHLVSRADPFFGGKLLIMFGGTLLDLRPAVPAPTGVDLQVRLVFGGLSVVVPAGWRVRWSGTVLGGGFEDTTEPTLDEDAPVLRIGGVVLAGGLRVSTRSPVEQGA